MRHFIIFLIASILALPALAQDVALNPKPFGLWVQELRQQALAQGVSQATFDDAFADAVPLERVVQLDRKQPESALSFEQYLANVVNDRRIAKGRALLDENHALLTEIGNKYGVQPRFIVALWGIETDFGAHTGGFRVVDSLATLAYEGRRAEFFRGELLKALAILDSEHMPSAALQGSWAGAMGQCQFMPGSFLTFAVDYDGDGKRDIWQSRPDIFASIANYLSTSGWNASEGWGKAVTLPANFDRSLADIKHPKPIAEWASLGVRNADGTALPAGDASAAVIFIGDAPDAPSYLVTGNFNVILKWNRSRYFATSVGMLADKIGR